MSYTPISTMRFSLGQAKWVPGQISFTTTRTGKLPNLQPLIEAGLPYAPYIEHGSYVTGQPDIARYGRDPYRGISGMGDSLVDWACSDHEFSAGWRDRVNQGLNTGTQAAVLGAAIAGVVGGLVKRPIIGAVLGAAIGWGTHAIWTAPQRISE